MRVIQPIGGMVDRLKARSRDFQDKTTMADKNSLRLIGFLVASITCAVVFIAAMLVHKTAAGELMLDDSRAMISAPR